MKREPVFFDVELPWYIYASLLIFALVPLLLILWTRPGTQGEAGRITLAEYKPGFGSRIIEANGPFNGFRELWFENGKRSEVPASEDITFMLKPGEVVLLAPNGSLQVREDYLTDNDGYQADKREGEQR